MVIEIRRGCNFESTWSAYRLTDCKIWNEEDKKRTLPEEIFEV